MRYAETTQPPAREIESLTLENEEDVFKEPEETCEAEAREAMEEEEAWMTAVFVAFRDDSVQVARGRGVTGSYLIVRRSAWLPRFDERFVNYGYNKVQQIEHLRAAGFDFYILNNAFVMDMPHPDSTFRRDYVDGIRGDALRMRSVFASFLSAINDKYANRSRFPICTKVLDSYYVPLE